MIVIKGGKLSPFVRKVLVACEEKGIPYAAEDLVPFPKTPELLALNPLGKIPILQDGDFVIPDSSVIIAYLERLHLTPALYPEDPQEVARALFLEEYADTKLAEVCGAFLFERIIKPNFFQQETDEKRLKAVSADDLPPVLDYLESRVEPGAGSLLARFGIADVAVGVQLMSLSLAGVDVSTHPNLAAYAETLLGRPSFKAVVPELP